MNLVAWNCQGAQKPSFQNTVRDLAQAFSPTVMIISKTKVGGARAKSISDHLPFNGAIHANTIGLTSGLWVLWDSTQVEISELASTEQEIHVLVKVLSSNISWHFSAIYASPRYAERNLLWKNLSTVAASHSLPWILAGDFNEVLTREDKLGGRAVNIHRALKFKECLDKCRMINLGFFGPKYTESNKRPLTQLIQERIDRVFVTLDWNEIYPEASVQHLEKIQSDHWPILLSLHNPPVLNLPRPFRFQSIWQSHPNFSEVVKNAWALCVPLPAAVNSFTTSAKMWNKTVFRNIFRRKEKLRARLKGIQMTLSHHPTDFLVRLEKTLRVEFVEVFELEEEFWAMKSRIN